MTVSRKLKTFFTIPTMTLFAIAGWTVLAAATAAEFQGLGHLPGGDFSEVSAVSADGSVVVGNSKDGGRLGASSAFRWSADTGMVGLGFLDGPNGNSWAQGVSADGSVVVGADFTSDMRAFRWTLQGGIEEIAGGRNAFGASADGSVVAGIARGRPSRPYRWTEQDGLERFDLQSGYEGGYGHAISDDGSTIIVGQDYRDPQRGRIQHVFRWTRQGGMQNLGQIPGHPFHSWYLATDVSPDGSVVVGYGSAYNRPSEAFRWTEETGMAGLGFLPGSSTDTTGAEAVSADGSIVVGSVGNWWDSEDTQHAFIWNADDGMQRLQDVLIDDYALGAELSGWTLTSARGVSADGQTIMGGGINPDGNHEAWRAQLSAAGADLNMDGFVDGLDLGTLLGNFDQNGIPASGGELNDTDPVDGLDLGILLSAWNPPPPPGESSAVPEPASMALLALAGAALVATRRFRNLANG